MQLAGGNIQAVLPPCPVYYSVDAQGRLEVSANRLAQRTHYTRMTC